MRFIDLKRQYAKQRNAIGRAIQRVLDHGQFVLGPEVQRLEEYLAAYVGAKHCISVASGTDSLHIALMALGIGPGDEVITVPFTFISTAQVIRLCGARPVFVDIGDDDLMMDPEQLQAAITPRTKAILPVGLYGQMPKLQALQCIADRHGIPIIEDAAQTFGAESNGVASCGASLVGSTSFYPTKCLGAYGDGGALFTNDDQMADRMRSIRTHGGQVRDHYECLGLNSRLDTLQASILLAKLSYYSEELTMRNQVALRYSALLAEACRVPEIMPGNTHVFALYTVRCVNRDAVFAVLKAHNVPSCVYYSKCLHEQPAFADLGYRMGSFPVAERAAREVLSLPMHPWLTEEEQDQVVAAMHAGMAVAAGDAV